MTDPNLYHYQNQQPSPGQGQVYQDMFGRAFYYDQAGQVVYLPDQSQQAQSFMPTTPFDGQQGQFAQPAQPYSPYPSEQVSPYAQSYPQPDQTGQFQMGQYQMGQTGQPVNNQFQGTQFQNDQFQNNQFANGQVQDNRFQTGGFTPIGQYQQQTQSFQQPTQSFQQPLQQPYEQTYQQQYHQQYAQLQGQPSSFAGQQTYQPSAAQPGMTPAQNALPSGRTDIDIPKKSHTKAIVTVIVVIVLLTGLAFAIFASGSNGTSGNSSASSSAASSSSMSSSSSASSSSQAATDIDPTEYKHVSYTNIARKPDDYIGQKMQFVGDVIQVIEDTENALLLAVNGEADDSILVTYDPSIFDGRILEDDGVRVYGTFEGIVSYESILGETISVPSIDAAKIELLSEEEMSSQDNMQYTVSIDSCNLATDYEGNPAAVISMTFANNSDETISFMGAADVQTFQNGIELNSTIITSSHVEYDEQSIYNDVKPKAKLVVQEAYQLDSGDPLTVEVSVGSYRSKTLIAKREFPIEVDVPAS